MFLLAPLMVLGGGALVGTGASAALGAVMGFVSSLVSDAKSMENQRLATQAAAEAGAMADLTRLAIELGLDEDLNLMAQELQLATYAVRFRQIQVGYAVVDGTVTLKDGRPAPNIVWVTPAEERLLMRYLKVGQRSGRLDWDAPMARALLKYILSEQTSRASIAPVMSGALG